MDNCDSGIRQAIDTANQNVLNEQIRIAQESVNYHPSVSNDAPSNSDTTGVLIGFVVLIFVVSALWIFFR